MKTLLALLVAALAFGCGGSDMPDAPTLQEDRTQLGFGTENGTGVFVGTKPVETLMLTNQGLETLTITNVTVSGTNAALFTADVDKKSVESLQHAFVQVTYAPDQPGKHEATLEITSNAANKPSLKVALKAEAVKP